MPFSPCMYCFSMMAEFLLRPLNSEIEHWWFLFQITWTCTRRSQHTFLSLGQREACPPYVEHFNIKNCFWLSWGKHQLILRLNLPVVEGSVHATYLNQHLQSPCVFCSENRFHKLWKDWCSLHSLYWAFLLHWTVIFFCSWFICILSHDFLYRVTCNTVNKSVGKIMVLARF